MRSIKKIIGAYSWDFWVFSILIIAMTFLLYTISNEAPEGGIRGMTETRLTEQAQTNTFIIMLGAVSILFVLLMQDNTLIQTSPLTWFSLRAGQYRKKASQSDHHSNILMLTALVLVFIVNLFCRYVSGQPFYILLIETGIIAVTLFALLLTIYKGMSVRQLYIVITASIVMPVVVALPTGDFMSANTPPTYVWVIASVVFAKFLSGRRASQIFFKLAVCVSFAGVIIETLLTHGTNNASTLQFVIVVLSVGFVIFSSLDHYITSSSKNYAHLEKVNLELNNTQSQLIQREQMATLGRLIAGVAHEINTPIGAIKASGELMDKFDFGTVLRDAARYCEEDIEALTAILDIGARSLKNMRSTIDLRRGKTQVLAYLKSIEIPQAAEISKILASFEICDIEKIALNQDLFRRGNIMDILQTAKRLMPLLSSVQNVRFSSEKVTKIVFALKTFSHMNTTGGESEFDVVKNIDNVLVLYLNQLKRGVEVIRQYDDHLPYIYGNVEEIGQVWTNIVQNAIYAMSYVGKLTIRIKNVDNKAVEVSFTDTGTGIKPENMDKIFEPFFTTKPLGEGSGIGMDISRKVIQKHKGDIRVESVWGQGTTFTVTLPAKVDRAPRRSVGVTEE